METKTIIVGYDGSARSQDALVLARRLAAAVGGRLVLAQVYPHDPVPLRGDTGAYEELMRQDAERMLAQADAPDAAERRAVPSPSAARGLHQLAEDEDAVLIVVGSSHRGSPGRVEPGSLSQRLIHGSPCAVAVAPVGYAEGGALGRGADSRRLRRHQGRRGGSARRRRARSSDRGRAPSRHRR
jgi:nucleotide-binding universal stress UspA family protein